MDVPTASARLVTCRAQRIVHDRAYSVCTLSEEVAGTAVAAVCGDRGELFEAFAFFAGERVFGCDQVGIWSPRVDRWARAMARASIPSRF